MIPWISYQYAKKLFERMNANMSRTTIFLSHSSKDITKVRQIRDILEALDYEPLLFYLKCLDDDNQNLETFIKKEIEARNIFIYCKSEHSEKSVWVQKELDYIKSFDSKRLYTIDITLPFRETIVQLLQSITGIIKNNRVFISCSRAPEDSEFEKYLESFLTAHNYEVIRYATPDYAKDEEHKRALLEAGAFIAVISYNFVRSIYRKSELGHVLHNYNRNPEGFETKVIPIYFNVNPSLLLNTGAIQSGISQFEGLNISDRNALTDEEAENLLKLIRRKDTRG